MPKYEDLLQEFETASADGANSLMQQVARRLHEEMARYNWVGFYLMEVPAFDALALGPYVGSFMPTLRIPLDKGLCGAAATSGQTVAVNNVCRRSSLPRVRSREAEYRRADFREESGCS